ncbi:MAG TPA: acetyl-CoA C-acyltransferase [Planctomycetota bacterium]|jgi:acetyl-CoA acetyltransferase family protein|nr:acetyl-CoA C-acyltransferase [Planctomycetota bacterium]
MTRDVVLLGGARTAMAEYSGTPGFGLFRDVSAIDLGAAAIRGALAKTGVRAEDVQHVVMGNALQTSSDAIYGARHAALKGGIPVPVPALTVNRLCGSGLEAAATCARMILLGEADVTVAGGMENLSQAPFVMRGLREGVRFGSAPVVEDLLFAALRDPLCGLFMAQTAERLASKYGISREAQDEYAFRSHALGSHAVKEGVFAEEIVAVTAKVGGKEVVVERDDHVKPDTTLEALARLRPAFGKDGTVTAGNASGIVDAAAALVLASEEWARGRGLRPLARLRAHAVAGVPPDIMGIGPVPAIRAAADKAGVSVDGIDLFEINEAFAAQYLAVEKELGLDRAKVNVNGGAIALGHPLGATGARLLLTLTRELRRRTGRLGVASACIGGGQGIAVLIERTA